MRVLIAEDDFTSRCMLAALLKKAGHDPLETVNGLEAWEELQKPNAPRIVLLDYMMPGMDGLEVLRRVRTLPTEPPPYILFLTANAEKESIVAGLSSGANDYLAKPFDSGELLARLEVGVRMVQLQAQLVSAINEIKDGLKSAGIVQQRLLPKNNCNLPLAQFSWEFAPCEAVGGDIFNYFNLDERHIGMYMLDVAGHGPSAALVSVLTYQYMSPNGAVLIDRSASPPCVRRPNDVLNILRDDFPLERFNRHFTIVYAILDTYTGNLSYSNAAHCAPLLVPRRGEVRSLDAGGTVIGLSGAMPYEVETVVLSHGDRVVFYSDGVVEMKNSINKTFGLERVRNILDSNRSKSNIEMVNALFSAAFDFGGRQYADDDVSIFSCSFEEQNSKS